MMGFTPTFYAGRPKLSEVTIDSDLDMGGRGILRVGRIDSPYMPETWPTVELDWGDVPPSETVALDNQPITTTKTDFVVYTATKDVDLTPKLTCNSGNIHGGGEIKVNGSVVRTLGVDFPPGYTVTFPKMRLYAGDVLTFALMCYSIPEATVTCTLLDDGIYIGAKTFDLTGKWLALGLDMQGLAATVKIQGIEMPYSDYAKYFPLAPTELKIPGGWDVSQIRPTVEVYV